MRVWMFVAVVLLGSNGLGCDAIKERLGQKSESVRAEESGAESGDAPAKKKKKKKKAADDEPSEVATGAAPAGDPGGAAAIPPPTLPAAPAVDYFADATDIPKLYKAKITGPIRLLEILIYPTYGKAQIVDSTKPTQADSYDFRNGVISESVPLRFSGKEPTKEDLQRNSFAIEELDFALIPSLTKDAVTRLKYEDGKVSHIIIKRVLPFSSDVRFRVYAKSARLSGSVEYDLKGKMIKVRD